MGTWPTISVCLRPVALSTLARVSKRNYRTQLAHERDFRGLTQAWMSEKTGIPLRTYRRLENGEIGNPPIGYLVNCALVLDVPLEKVCESAWLRWMPFSADAKAPAGRALALASSSPEGPTLEEMRAAIRGSSS